MIRHVCLTLSILILLVTIHWRVSAETAPTVTRPADPVVLQGSELPAFLNQPINQLALYRWSGSAWVSIPFQIDEVNSLGAYVATGADDDDSNSSLLDANDQLVFMSADAGSSSACSNSLSLISDSHSRQQISIADPLGGDPGVVYLYQGVAASTDRYVDWVQATQVMSGTLNSRYEVTFGGVTTETTTFFGMDDLSINGSNNVLDRQKLRISADATIDFGLGCGLGFTGTENLTEESVELFFPEIITPTITGPVRTVIGDSDGDFAAFGYGSRLDFNVSVDPLDIEDSNSAICDGTLSVNYIRSSFDLLDPAAHGVDTYYDNHTAGSSLVDGSADAGLPNSGSITWYQLSDDGTHGGVITAFPSINSGNGSLAHYYVDDSAGTPSDGIADTGVAGNYADTGMSIVNSDRSTITLSLVQYILPTGTNSNVGSTWSNYANNPLTAASGASGNQTCAPVTTAVSLTSAETARPMPTLLLILLTLLLITIAAYPRLQRK